MNEFRRKYNARKRREELAKVRREGRYNLDSDEESSETEDEDAELLTQSKDDQIARTLEMIKNRDPRIYQKDTEFYNKDEEEDEEGASKKKKTKAMYAKDYIRHSLLGDTKLQDLPDEKPSYPEEQETMKRQFKAALNGVDHSEMNRVMMTETCLK